MSQDYLSFGGQDDLRLYLEAKKMNWLCRECTVTLSLATSTVTYKTTQIPCGMCGSFAKLLYGYTPEQAKLPVLPEMLTKNLRCVSGITGSVRNCNMTVGCTGTMYAVGRRYENGQTHCWFYCNQCRQQAIAKHVKAKIDTRVVSVLEAEKSTKFSEKFIGDDSYE